MSPEAREDFCALTTPEARAGLADRQLAALAEREAVVRAFVCHDAGAARRRIAQHPPGPLSGALIGVKDIIATADFPTHYGSRNPAVIGPRVDAWCVSEARRRGGIILGKTVCTELAFPLPGPTTNPHDAKRTPGGSSSGSAAAVAAGFVSFALGTQTAGSTIRPASYCGVTGFKPSYGLLHLEGVQAISSTCDHVGLFAHSPRDAWYFVSATIASRAEILAPRAPKRVLRLRIPAEIPQADGYPERLDALEGRLRQAGIEATAIDLPFPVSDLRGLQQKLCYWEAARILLEPGGQHIVPELRQLLEPYLEIDLSAYAAARQRRQTYQAQFETLATRYDAVLLPAATGIAPLLASTGDAVMSRFWTALHVPAMTVPMWRSAEGMPLGLQLLGRMGEDRALAEVAEWFYRLT